MRREILIAIPVLGLAVIFQTAIISRIVLLSGCADLVLLILAAWGLQERVRGAWIWGVAGGLLIGFVSGIHWFIYLPVYLLVVGMARLMTRRIWQAPLLAMFMVTMTGTLVLLLVTFLYRSLTGASLVFKDVLVQIILPSALLNLLWAIPIHALIRDIAGRLYPLETA
jgi:hypothetical protein